MTSTKRRIVVVLLALLCLFAGMSNGESTAWDCPECGRKGNTGKYCGACGYAAWDCSECGRKGNVGKFCGSCGHPAPEAMPASAAGEGRTNGAGEQPTYDETLTTLNTGHFVVSVPSSWIHVQNKDTGFDYYYAKTLQKIDGGYLAIKQDDSLLEYADITGSRIDDLLNDFAGGVIGDREGIIEHTTVNGFPSVTIRYAISATQYANIIGAFHEGYVLSVGYLDENYDSEETWEIAQHYFSTIHLANNPERVSGNSTSKETPYVIYPKSFTSSLKQYAIPLPAICYTTPASENGYGGLPSYVDGMVTKIYAENEAANNTPKIISLSTEYGPVIFKVVSPDYMLTRNTNPLLNTESGRAAFYAVYDQTMDYTLPEEGESVRIYGVYDGYSSVMEAGSLTFGLDEFLYSSAYGEYDPDKFSKQ